MGFHQDLVDKFYVTRPDFQAPMNTQQIDKRRGGDGKGFYIRTFMGNKFHWDDIEHNTVDVKDVAHALAMNCRWTGHTKRFYSVAQHSYHVAAMVPEEHRLAALFHDASEAYVHDTPSPLKWYLAEHDFTAFTDLEKRVDRRIYEALNIRWPRDPCIKEADLRMLATENRELMPYGEERMYMVEPFPFPLPNWGPDEAEIKFLEAYHTMKGNPRYGAT